MSDFSDNVRKAFETYLLGNKKEAFNYLIPGSYWHQYLSALDALKTEKHMISKETSKIIENLKNIHGYHACENLSLKELFLKYEGVKTKAEKEEILDKIGSSIGIITNHPKPMDLIRKLNKASKEEEKKNKLNCGKGVYDTLFDSKNFISNAINAQYGIANRLHKCYWNDLDFNKLTDE